MYWAFDVVPDSFFTGIARLSVKPDMTGCIPNGITVHMVA